MGGIKYYKWKINKFFHDRPLLSYAVICVIVAFLFWAIPKLVSMISILRRNTVLRNVQKKQIHRAEMRVESTKKRLRTNKKKSLIDIIEIARYYQNGVLDKYDLDGNKIYGVKPNGERAIHYFIIAFREKGHVGSGFAAANLLVNGCGDMKPNYDQATALYREIEERWGGDVGVDEELESARAHMVREMSYPTSVTVNGTNSGKGTVHLINRLPKSEDWRGVDYDKPIQLDQLLRDGRKHPRWQENFNHADFMADGADLPAHILNIPDTGLQNLGHVGPNHPAFNHQTTDMRANDMHNVHDSSLNGSVAHSLNKMKEQTRMGKNKQQTISEVREFIEKYAKNDKKADALKALDAIERNPLPVSHTKMKEVDTLNVVWNRIHDPKNSEFVEQLKENLVDELTDCVEFGKVQCATGRVNRIVDTLNCVDPEVTLKHTAAVNGEVMNLAGQIRTKMMEDLNEADKKAMEAIEDNDVQAKFNAEYKQKLETKCKEDYVDTGIVRKDEMDKMVSQWTDAV